MQDCLNFLMKFYSLMRTNADFDQDTQQLIECLYFIIFLKFRKIRKGNYSALLLILKKKTFDAVWRDALWYKMHLNNINGNMYKVIFNMYQNIKSCLFYNGNKSEYFPCEKESDKGTFYPLFYSRYF
jgi:hypothetical protein